MARKRHQVLFMRFRSRVSIWKPSLSQMSLSAKFWGFSITRDLARGSRLFIDIETSNLPNMSCYRM